MVGGIFTSFLLELLVYPAVYEVWRWGPFPKTVTDNQGFESIELQAAAGLTRSRLDVESPDPAPRITEMLN